MRDIFRIAGYEITPGSRATIEVALARLFTHADMSMPVHVIHGKRTGPCLLVSGAVHGDELIGAEIIRRLLKRKSMASIRGTLIAVPVVNVYGFIAQSRYLPDRRDLNRSFPGSKSGSLASRLANMFAREIVSKCTHGIDLHTGSHHRSNLPQIRACLDDSETRRLAALFGAPVMINSDVRDGSLRQYAHERGIHMLLYEAGEPLRLDRASIRLGVSGVVSIMKAIGMLPGSVKSPSRAIVPHKTQWVRAPVSGMFRASVPLGAEVSKSDRLGLIADPFGEGEKPVLSPLSGVVIGKLNLPLVHRGDALFNIGMSRYPGRTHEVLEAFREKYEPQDT